MLDTETATPDERMEAHGPRPFVTRRLYRRASGSLGVWSSRHHRKGLVVPEERRKEPWQSAIYRSIWMTDRLNWWIGIVFAIGSLLFITASVFTLVPRLSHSLSLDGNSINAIYFAGSIPFTLAAYLQLFQAANSEPIDQTGVAGRDTRPSRFKVIGWMPKNIGWLSCALQFPGTVLFNFNTFDAMIPSLSWFEQDLIVWVPNIVGSILFLVSGYLAFAETCHAYWAWRPSSLSWWIVFINLLGCLGFMASAVLSIVLPRPTDHLVETLAVAFTLQGAICFFLGAILMLPEMAIEREEQVGMNGDLDNNHHGPANQKHT